MRRGRFLAAVSAFLVLASGVQADLTVDDIIGLTSRGVASGEILEKIRVRSEGYDLSPQEIIRMRQAGVDPDVIVAMIEHEPASGVSEDEQDRSARVPEVPDEPEPPAAVPDRVVASPPQVESLRIENRSTKPLYITFTESRLVLSRRAGRLLLSANHYYLFERTHGSISLVLEETDQSRTIRILQGKHTRLIYRSDLIFTIAEGIDPAYSSSVIKGLAPGADLACLARDRFADRIVSSDDERVEEYRGEWVAVSPRNSVRAEVTPPMAATPAEPDRGTPSVRVEYAEETRPPPAYDYESTPPAYDYESTPPAYDYESTPPAYDYECSPSSSEPDWKPPRVHQELHRVYDPPVRSWTPCPSPRPQGRKVIRERRSPRRQSWHRRRPQPRRGGCR